MGEALQLARMPEQLLEARLSRFLGFVLDDESLARALSVQERYYLLMQYLSVQNGSPLATNADYGRYLLKTSQREPWQSSIATHGLIVSHLTGNQAEILETLCEDVADWVLGAMAFQCSLAAGQWPPLPPESAKNDDHANIMRQRIAILENMDQSAFNSLYDHYLVTCDRLSRFVRTGFDAMGVTVLGGADDAPARFRAAASLNGIIERLGRCLVVAG